MEIQDVNYALKNARLKRLMAHMILWAAIVALCLLTVMTPKLLDYGALQENPSASPLDVAALHYFKVN